jgi:hypothetical protein
MLPKIEHQINASSISLSYWCASFSMKIESMLLLDVDWLFVGGVAKTLHLAHNLV